MLNPELSSPLTHVYTKQVRERMCLEKFLEVIEEKGPNFRFGYSDVKTFCNNCGSPNHVVTECPLVPPTIAQLELKLPYDREM